MKQALKTFDATDQNAMNDLFLHMVIRQNYKTIPIVRKVFNRRLCSTISCSHLVLDKGRIEIWLGASAINKDLKSATIQAMKNVEFLFTKDNIKDRLLLITEKMDASWPFKNRLEKIADNSIPIKDRFDRIIVPIFITHDSDTINKYDENKYVDDFQKEIDECRLILNKNFSSETIQIIDLRVFISCNRHV